MFGVKTKIFNRFKNYFEVTEFSKKNISKFDNKVFTLIAKKRLNEESKLINLQNPLVRKVNPFATNIIKATANYMPNNLGNWSIKEPNTLTSQVEQNLIKILKQYYHCNDTVIGHCGSGTTEGNIYATWIGRNYLLKKLSLKSTDHIVLIKSCLAHYSIDKAADLTGINLVKISINRHQFNLDQKELTKKINNLYKKGIKGFLIPLTLGYTLTGTDDDYQNICSLVERFKKSHTDCEFFLWIDAAATGIYKIFTEKNFEPLTNENIQLISTDFHKFLAVPYPANVLLYRKSLLNYIKKYIPYIDQMDTTLLGSRPGINVLSAWISLLNLNEKKMRKSIRDATDRKETFLTQISKEHLDIEIINNVNSLQACLISNNHFSQETLANKYKLQFINYNLLIKAKSEKLNLYKLYFLPNFN